MAKWRLKKGITWRDKLEREHPSHGKIVRVPPRMQKRFGKGTMLIPHPLDIDGLIRNVRKKRLISQSRIRASKNSRTPAMIAVFR